MTSGEDQALRERFAAAEADETGRLARQSVCRAVAASLLQGGELLWTGGYILGSDRRDGASPFEFGDDATVGLALVLQIGGELTEASAALLERDSLYAAAALLRQLVEVEYLAWAFAEDKAEAMDWLRSTKGDRWERWRPKRLRDRAGGRFRGSDYARHCELGGHPTPEAMTLLAGHSARHSTPLWWTDLAFHASSTWNYALAGAQQLDWHHQLDATATSHGLPAVIEAWRRDDELRTLVLDSRPSGLSR